MFDALTRPVSGDWADGLWAILMLGMALLAWREFRGIRARMKADKEREAQAKRDAEADRGGPSAP